MTKLKTETKVGIFALASLLVIGFITLKIGSSSFVFSRGYEVKVVIDHAIGIRTKTPVEIAGIKVGSVKSIRLLDSRRAELTLLLDNDLSLPIDTKAVIRSKGMIGEILVELLPGTASAKIAEDGEIEYGGHIGDMNLLMGQFSSIADDIKAVSSSLKDMMGGRDDAPFRNVVRNLEKFTETLANNQANFDKVANNLAELTEALRGTVKDSRENVEDSIERIASITKKIDEGKGTVGKLVNNDATVNKLNDAIDNLNNTLGNLKSLEMEIGYHTEYLTASKDLKHYVNFTLSPKPDKSIIFDFVQDPSPSPDTVIRDTSITTGGTTTTIHTETDTVQKQRFRMSAQLAKKFYDFTLRGGIIELRGGVGVDYEKGPFGAHFSAFDFNTDNGQRPHLKATGTINVTKNLYLMGGADDMLNQFQNTDWFFGAGIRLVDDDVKSLLSLGGGALKK